MKHAKQKTSVPGKLSRIYAVAQEMQMDLVAAYRNSIYDEVYSCRCFQGDADYIASLLEDLEYDEYAREVKQMFSRAMANDTDNA